MNEENDSNQDQNNADTRYEKFCKKWNINSNLVMLKLTLFVLYGGMNNISKNIYYVLSILTKNKFFLKNNIVTIINHIILIINE